MRERETIAVKRLERAYHLALLRYRAGLSNYLTVLSAEGNLIAERVITSYSIHYTKLYERSGTGPSAGLQ